MGSLLVDRSQDGEINSALFEWLLRHLLGVSKFAFQFPVPVKPTSISIRALYEAFVNLMALLNSLNTRPILGL